jgi:hypothetical protein
VYANKIISFGYSKLINAHLSPLSSVLGDLKHPLLHAAIFHGHVLFFGK